jgi:hypothetical protein
MYGTLFQPLCAQAGNIAGIISSKIVRDVPTIRRDVLRPSLSSRSCVKSRYVLPHPSARSVSAARKHNPPTGERATAFRRGDCVRRRWLRTAKL